MIDWSYTTSAKEQVEMAANRSALQKQRKSLPRGMRKETAYELLREMIVTGRIAPGSWVMEADLAERLGFGRTPVHGALQLLQSAGYAIEHRSGTKTRYLIPPLTMDDAHELYRIVGRLEGYIGERIALMSKQERVKLVWKLSKINAEIQSLAKQGQSMARQIFDRDAEFHRVFVEAGGGPRLLAFHRAIKPQIERYWLPYASTIVSDAAPSAREHEGIISAIRRGEAQAIQTAIEANWLAGFNRIAKLIEMFGERGNW